MLGKKLSRQVQSLGQKFSRRTLSLGQKSKDFLKAGDIVLRKGQNTLQNVVNPLLSKTGVPELQGLGNLSLEAIKGLRAAGQAGQKGIERLEKSNARKVLEDLAENRNPLGSFV
jgi:hypothetical protein